MRAVIQRVTKAAVSVNNKIKSSIGPGLLILVGIEDSDDQSDLEWLSNKIVRLRIFNDQKGIMNLSVQEFGGEIMIISQFTLHASTKKGNRPSYIRAAEPGKALAAYNQFIRRLSELFGKEVMSGEFGSVMQIELINDGPVTIVIDTKEKE